MLQVLASINPRIPGQQRVRCQLVARLEEVPHACLTLHVFHMHRRQAEVETGMHRFECAILQFGSPLVGSNSSLSLIAAGILHRFDPVILSINTSGDVCYYFFCLGTKLTFEMDQQSFVCKVQLQRLVRSSQGQKRHVRTGGLNILLPWPPGLQVHVHTLQNYLV